MKLKPNKLAAMVALALACQSVHAGEKEELEALRQTTLNLIDALVQQGVLTRDKADTMVKHATVSPAPKTVKEEAVEPGVVRVPYIPETVKREIREQIRNEVVAQARNERWGDPGSLPDWLSRFKLDGDLRMRFQKDIFDQYNTTPASLAVFGINVNNTTEDRSRLRVRARLNVGVKVSEDFSGGVRLSTGSTSDPVSTNQTMGNSFNKYALVLDRAFVKYDPYRWLSISGGRIANPWFSTDLVWDEDLNFEGVAATLKPVISDNVTGFITAGAFSLQEIESSDTVKAKSKWLYGAQAGVEWVGADASRFKAGLGYYKYNNIAGRPNPTLGSTIYNLTAPQYRQKGNTVFNIDYDGDATTNLFALAPNFHELNLTAMYDWATFDPIHVKVIGDYVKNIGFDRQEILQRSGLDVPPKTKGYQAKVQVGMQDFQKPGNWQAYVGYRHLERDAVLDAFTDSDFHLGGTDTKGYFVGGNYAIAKNAWLGVRWMSADQIDGPPLAIDVLQVDLNAKF